MTSSTKITTMTSQISILFIDANVLDYQLLLAGLAPDVYAHLLTDNRDGVEQISEILDRQYGHRDIETIHFVSHVAPGCLYLGNSELSLDTLEHYAETIQDWPKTKLSIYGCNVATGDAGEEFITKLHNLMGVAIHASTTKVGCTALGGNWELDAVVPSTYGTQSTELPFNPSEWVGVLDLDLDTVTDLGATAATDLANQIFGSGVTVNSASYSGGGAQAAIFTSGTETSFDNNIISFSSGVIFSTGTAASVGGPNNADNLSIDAVGGVDGDTDFNTAAGGATLDASFLEVNFTPDVPSGASVGQTGRMTIEIVFGSDEYNEYVYGNVNDTLAVFVNGVNQATVPNGLAIGIDTINDAGNFSPANGNDANDPNPDHDSTDGVLESANPSLFINNDVSDLGATPAANTQMDGYTIKIPVTFDVVLGQANTIKIGIADTADALFDSWMFVRADSAQTLVVAENDTVSTPANVPSNIDVTTNDYDADGDPLSVIAIADQPISLGDTVTLPSGIDVTLELDGTLTVAGDGTTEVVDTFTYEVTDGNGNSSIAFVKVTTTAPVVNTPPVISTPTGSPAAVNFAENGTGTVVDVESSDTEDGAETNLTYSLSGTDASLFSIDADGNITFNSAPDFEAPSDAGGNNIYDLTVTTTDSGGLTDTQDLQVTVTDFAAEATIAANDATGLEPIDNGQFTVTLSNPSATDTEIAYSVTGDATAGSDYSTLSGTVTVLAGNTTATIDVTVLDDNFVEDNETVTVTLDSIASGDANITIGTTNSDTVTIGDTDTAEVSLFAFDDIAAEPNNNGQFTVTISQPSDTATVVNYSVTGAATPGSDYQALTGSVTIAAGDTSAVIDVTVIDESLVEDNEAVTVTLDSVTGDNDISIGALNTDTVTISDDDTASLSLSVADATAGEPTDDGQFTITLSEQSDQDTVVAYSVTGTANAGEDFTPLTGTVTIAAGETTATIDVSVLDDNILEEAAETLTLTLDIVTAGDADITIDTGNNSGTVNISDNDTALLSISATDVNAR